ncbi:unnamed protein product, partial [marine sediment metagenome]
DILHASEVNAFDTRKILIEHQTFTDETSVTFNSASIADYEYLIFFVNITSVSGADCYGGIRFNGDTGNNYNWQSAAADHNGDDFVMIEENGYQAIFKIIRQACARGYHIINGTFLNGKLKATYWDNSNAITSVSITRTAGADTFSGYATLYGYKTA